MMIRKFYTLVLSLFLFSCLANAQSWPQGSGSPASFDGFGMDYQNYEDDEYSNGATSENTSSGIFGNNAFISTMADDGGWGGTPTDPAQTVPIAESILGLLGLGGAYAWKLIRGKNKQEKKD